MRNYHLFYLIILLLFGYLAKSIPGQILKSGDGVRVIFYNISDPISGDYFCQQDGNIQLPYIGLVRGQEREFRLIRQEIESKYDSLYRNPELTVQPLIKVNVLGEVRKPGIIYVTGVETLRDAIALAGGETSDSNLEKIHLIRGVERIDINAKQMIKEGKNLDSVGLQSGDQIFVPREWWVAVRNWGVVVSAAGLVVAIIALLAQ
jgi:polysaccharide export outer membrane protein